MPELPEVEVVRAGLERHVVGATITARRGAAPAPVRRDPRGPAGFAAALTGRRIEAARRRGKYLWLPLDNGDALLGHLGMSGQMLVQPPGAPDERHLRVRFALDGDGRGPPSCGSSTSGCSAGCRSPTGGAELPPEIAHIARDPLDPEFDDDAFVRRVRKRTSGIKRQLLDQTLVSGVGNIYADEALWRARVHGERPRRPAHRRARSASCSARPATVMVAALGQGGTSFDALYVNVNGESGYFDRSLHAYGREGEPCDRCGTPDPPGRVHEPVVVLLPGLPAGAAGARTARFRGAARLTGGPPSVTLEDGPVTAASPRTPEGSHMAKALIGTCSSDRGLPHRLAAENRQLRVRSRELEALVARLQEENDRLAVASAAAGSRPRSRAPGDAAGLTLTGPGSPHQRHPATTAPSRSRRRTNGSAQRAHHLR